MEDYEKVKCCCYRTYRIEDSSQQATGNALAIRFMHATEFDSSDTHKIPEMLYLFKEIQIFYHLEML